MVNPARLWYWSCQAYQARLEWLARLLKTINFLLFHAILPYQAQVGDDVSLEHYGLGVVIHPNVVIGRRVKIYHHVTLAAETWVGSEHKVVVEDDVVIGAGAIVIARINCGLTLGAGAKIGAGAVVTSDVAPGQVVVGCSRTSYAKVSEQQPLTFIKNCEEVKTALGISESRFCAADYLRNPMPSPVVISARASGSRIRLRCSRSSSV